jgi:hypothetical protein
VTEHGSTMMNNINTQNCRVWSSGNLHALHERSLPPQTICVWYTVSCRCLVVPMFFKTTVDRYTRISSEGSEHYRWLQQGVATCCTFCKLLDFLEEYFHSCLISKGLWPPGSPDLSYIDFFFWGDLKDRHVSEPSHT